MKSKIDENETQKGMRHLLCIYTHHTKECHLSTTCILQGNRKVINLVLCHLIKSTLIIEEINEFVLIIILIKLTIC
jgi:hypothetical protein